MNFCLHSSRLSPPDTGGSPRQNPIKARATNPTKPKGTQTPKTAIAQRKYFRPEFITKSSEISPNLNNWNDKRNFSYVLT